MRAPPLFFSPRPWLLRRAHAVAADDFDLPTTDFDSDTDETRAAPKRSDEEKWTELCLDEFLHPPQRRPQGIP